MFKKTTVGIDARLAGNKHAGIGRYTKNLINQVVKNEKYNFVFFFHDQTQAEEVLEQQIKKDNIKVVIVPIQHYSLKEQLLLPKIFNKQKLDLLHIPHFNIPLLYQKKLVVTIHDLLWHEYKGGEATTLSPLKYALKYRFYKFIVHQAVKKASKIIVPAQTIKRTVTHFYPKVSNKIVVTKEGGKIINHQPNTSVKKLKKTLLFVGSLYPHKNISLIIKALKQLPNYKLLIVGSRSIFRDQTKKYSKKLGVEQQIEFLGFLSNEELSKKYTQVTALVQPSLSEGFGLTGIEAMFLKTPVLASDIPIFREVYQSSAYYFSPHSELSFISALKELEDDKNQNEKLKKAKQLASSYSWEKMAKETLTVYQQVLATK